MLDLAAFVVCKDDIYYAEMSLRAILPFVKGVLVHDQMSTDGTYEELCRIKNMNIGNLVIERVDTGHKERFEQNYDEPKWRTMAVKRCEEIFKPAWVIKQDLDELFSEYLFQRLEELWSKPFPFEGIRLSGDRPISKDYWATLGSTELEKTEYSPEGGRFGDPHTQIWRAGKYYYMSNPFLKGTNFHPVLMPDPSPQYWLPGLNNYHIHRLFGPKAIAFWHEGHNLYGLDEEIDDSKPLYPPTSCPQWYNHEINRKTAEKREFKFPDFVLKKWAMWEAGIW